MVWYTNPMIWAMAFFAVAILLIIETFLIIAIRMFTYGFDDLKAKIKGVPICEFYDDSNRVTRKPIKPDSGLVQDEEFGTFLINEQGSYVDSRTKNIVIPFSAEIGTGASAKAFKISHDLMKILKNEKKMDEIRKNLAEGKLENSQMEALRESISFSHLRSLSNTILPHALTSKIEKTIASRMHGFGKVNPMQYALIFISILGAIAMGYILIKTVGA